MTLSRQEIDPASSLSSPTSPTTTVSSDSESRAREDLSGIDSHPVSTERTVRPVDQANQKSETKKKKTKTTI